MTVAEVRDLDTHQAFSVFFVWYTRIIMHDFQSSNSFSLAQFLTHWKAAGASGSFFPLLSVSSQLFIDFLRLCL